MATVDAAKGMLADAGLDKSALKAKVPDLLECLLNEEVLVHPVAYKIMAAVVGLIKDDEILEGPHAEIIFEAIEEMLELSDGLPDSDPSKKPAEEIASALFANACAYIQAHSLAVNFLPRLLNAMKREGNMKWASYPCVSPLLLSDIKAFQPHLRLLLNVMKHFPGEVLSVISDLYKLGPRVFEENIPLLIELYDESPVAQLSILNILLLISHRNPLIVEPYLQSVKDRTNNKPEHVVVVRDIEENVAKVLPPPPTSKSEADDDDVKTEPLGGPPPQRSISMDGGHRFLNLQQGVLRKKGRILGRTVTRWFTLDDDSFNFYRSLQIPSDEHQPKRKVPFKDIVDVQIINKNVVNNNFPFTVQTRSRTFILAAPTENDRTQWIAAFRRHMNGAT